MSLYFGMLSEYPYPLKIILREHSFYVWLDTDIVNISVQISYSTPKMTFLYYVIHYNVLHSITKLGD